MDPALRDLLADAVGEGGTVTTVETPGRLPSLSPIGNGELVVLEEP